MSIYSNRYMRQSYLEVPNFLGGVNEGVDESLIKTNEAKSLQNVDIKDGMLNSISGCSPYSSATTGYNGGTIMIYYDGVNKTILVANNGKINKLASNVYTELLSGFTSDTFDAVNFHKDLSKVMVMGNGVDNTKVFNGTNISDLYNRRPVYNDVGVISSWVDGAGATKATEALCTTLAPKMKFIELHFDRLWGAGDKDNPNRVYFSTAGVNGPDISDWTYPTAENEANMHGGFIDVNTYDGSTIIGLKTIFNDVLIFLNKTIFKIFGTDPSNYSKVGIFSSDGAIADKSIIGVHNKAYFVASEGLYCYDGTNVLPVSNRIKKTWDMLNKEYLSKAVAVFYNDKYILAVPEGNSAVNNLIIEYDTVNNNFVFIRGTSVSSFVELDGELLYTNSNGQVFVYNSGLTWNGTNISSFWETSLSSMGVQNAILNSDYIYFVASGSGSIGIDVTTVNNGKVITKTKTFILTANPIPYKAKYNSKGRMIGLKIYNISGSSFAIKSVKLMLEVDYD